MLNVIIILIALSLAIYLAFSKQLSKSSNWKGMLIPLASIMGSGFLISAPLLGGIVGNLAVIFMILLLILAFMVGGAIRFNIKFFEPIENEKGIAQNIASASRAFALYYSLQCMVAFFVAKKQNNLQRRNLYMINFLVLALICILVFFLGIPSG